MLWQAPTREPFPIHLQFWLAPRSVLAAAWPDVRSLLSALQETKDGEIVVFHDDTLARAVSDTGLNAAPAAALREAGLDYARRRPTNGATARI